MEIFHFSNGNISILVMDIQSWLQKYSKIRSDFLSIVYKKSDYQKWECSVIYIQKKDLLILYFLIS